MFFQQISRPITEPLNVTDVASAKQTKKRLLADFLERNSPQIVTEAEWSQIKELLHPVSDGYLRKLLRASDLAMTPLVEGVRQETWAELERTLLALGAEYEPAMARNDRERARACRRLVITAKDHARLAGLRQTAPAEIRAQKQEMVRWMLVWLENPAIFPAWVQLRKRRLNTEDSSSLKPS